MIDAPPSPYEEPSRLGSLLYVVAHLLGFGRHLASTVVQRAKHASFASIAVGFGTADLSLILARLERGILRAVALEQMLIARLDARRDIKPSTPLGYANGPLPEPKPPRPAREKDAASGRAGHATRARWDDLVYPPSFEEIEAQVRRRPVGRTILDICLDLAVLPVHCSDEFWNHLFVALHRHRGNFHTWYREQQRRWQAFRAERNRGPTNGWWDWQDDTKERSLKTLGFRIGEEPTLPPDLVPAPP